VKRPKPLPAVDRNAAKKTAAVPVGANVRPSFLKWPIFNDQIVY
jgi:hypothetical protein